MVENMGGELLAVHLFYERSGRARAYGPVAEMAETVGARADMERIRKRRARIARILKALAMRISPSFGREMPVALPHATLM